MTKEIKSFPFIFGLLMLWLEEINEGWWLEEINEGNFMVYFCEL